MKRNVILILLSIFCVALSAQRPNVVLIYADDISADMFSPYKQEAAAKTPNIEKMAENGLFFRTFYAPAICGPSRALMMTGVYANHTGAYRNDIWTNGVRKNIYTKYPSWAKILGDNGYKTAIAGKWHAGAQMPYEEVVGFDEHCLWESAGEIKHVTGIDIYAEGLRQKTTQKDIRYWHPCLLRNKEYVPVTLNDFGPDICGEFIMDFIERKAKADEPFVAYWPISLTHGPTVWTPDNGGPGNNFGYVEKPNTKGMSKADATAAKQASAERFELAFKGMTEYMDKLVGNVVAKVKELGIYDNTYIIFCSDNGTAVTAKDRGVERGVHVPMVICGADVKKIGATDELSDLSDIAPTLLDIAGVKPPANTQYSGSSLLPFITGKKATHRDWIYAYTGPVQVFRTKNFLLEARAPYYGKPDGRFYYTGNNRFGVGYKRAENNPEYKEALKQFKEIIKSLPDHLSPDHPHWKTKDGIKWEKKSQKERSWEKQLYNHKGYKRYDEKD
ncbi:hypothetical protein E9993_19645 [Labilibacter sediminis]|nr:hypothetical protein E9993_19645 [Labilibacter sediminis]